MSTDLSTDTIIGPDKGGFDGDHKRLNVGGGQWPIPGYLTVDRMFGDEAYPLAYDDESIDEVYASHILEHFGWAEYMDVLTDWVRVLKPGGVLRVAVPDIDRLMRMQGQPGIPPTGAVLMGGQLDENDFHKSAWSTPDLKRIFGQLGLVGISEFQSFTDDCSQYPFSANVEGYKPTETMRQAPHGQVTFCMSIPRLGFNMNTQKLMESIYKYNAPCVMEGGAYFDLSMEKGIQKALEHGTPYIITVDYDTVFEASHVWRLVALMERYRDYDAMAAVQLRRGEHKVLVSGKDGDEYTLLHFSDEVLPCRTAHFGLTIFRREVFERLPWPWMRHTEQDGKTIEADMMFWANLEAAGMKLGTATTVCIGHMEEFIVWPDRDYQPIYQEESEYHRVGRPRECHP